jgi:hypothetical protein
MNFSKNETLFLNNGPKYNLHTKKANWLTDLADEAENAIKQLPSTDCDFYRRQVARVNRNTPPT